ncbi:glycosyltransferase [Aequorivita sp. H23M31]|uniref:Glycosyltransferase n=1 Tax=Aequorivita ciconiae TaxID=2494375 RepID=A0A410G4M0_9FLAO|nr:glycosyltransferase family 2 protein [Aequorivita sp. H23M31]QAA82196.1 glycosyltransferase [Aequorivita sp. H23M31]
MRLLVVFPCFNEEEVLTNTVKRFFIYFENIIELGIISNDSRICFVDDGSVDKTWDIITSFPQKYINAIKFSNNFGHQNALLAGLENFKNEFDVYITLDVDLQDDFNVIGEMIAKNKEGFDIIYGVRNDRSTDSVLKRGTAKMFYTLMEKMGVKTINNHADFRLINNQALLSLLKFPESHLFLRAVFPLIGLNHTIVYYKRFSREEGESKYPLRKMLSFAWDGITSFSATPLRIVLLVGLLSIFLSFLLLLWAAVQLLRGNVIHGWFSMIAVVTFFGGIQTFAIGIIGEYIGKIYIQTKKRPRYIIDKIVKK